LAGPAKIWNNTSVTALLFFILFGSTTAQGKTVSAPLSANQALVNPAAGASRTFQSHSLRLNRNLETATLVDFAGVHVDTQVDTFEFISAYRWDAVFAEVSFFPQSANKVTVDGIKDNNNRLLLFPLQVVAGYDLGPLGSVGLKFLQTEADSKLTEDLSISNPDQTTTSTGLTSLAARYRVVGLGLAMSLYDSRYFFSYAADFTELKSREDVRIESRTTGTTGGSTEAATLDFTRSSAQWVRKDIFGLGYRSKGNEQNAIRLELSYERIPPLSKNTYLGEGTLIRAVAEGTWTLFHGGVEFKRRKGFYVDAMNLIPYFFNFEKFSDTPIDEVGFFGGFKLSRGQSVGLSYFESQETKKERFIAGLAQEFEVKRKTKSFGLSYQVVF